MVCYQVHYVFLKGHDALAVIAAFELIPGCAGTERTRTAECRVRPFSLGKRDLVEFRSWKTTAGMDKQLECVPRPSTPGGFVPPSADLAACAWSSQRVICEAVTQAR